MSQIAFVGVGTSARGAAVPAIGQECALIECSGAVGNGRVIDHDRTRVTVAVAVARK